MEPIRILLADDHTLFRKGIRTLLEQMPDFDVVGEAASGQEAVAQARELVPDAILMDIKMPEISGIEATRQILQENPHVGVILVTMFNDPESVFSGMRAGARGYVLKEAEPEELRRAIEAAYRGEVLLGPIIAGKVLEHFGRDPKRLGRDSAADGRTAPAGLRHPSHRTGLATFTASGSPSDGLDQGREHRLFRHLRRVHTSLLRCSSLRSTLI